MMRFAFVVSICLAAPAYGDAPLDGDAFEAYVAGRTLSFGAQGTAQYGVEHYLPDKRVIWSRGDGVCTNGVWYEEDGDICFLYDGDPEPKCWAIYVKNNKMTAIFTTRPDTTVIFETQDTPIPLVCDNLSS